MPHGYLFASLKYGDKRFVAASQMFQVLGGVCSVAAALGNPRNFGSKKEKLFIILCSLSNPAYYAVQAYALGSPTRLIVACFWALICPPCFLSGIKLCSNLSDSNLGDAITSLFKSLPGVLVPILYISTESFRCIMDSTPDANKRPQGFH